MEFDVTALKRLVDDTIMTEAKCVEVVRGLLVREDLKNPTVNRLIELLGVWTTTPSSETLKKLEELQSQIRG